MIQAKGKTRIEPEKTPRVASTAAEGFLRFFEIVPRAQSQADPAVEENQ